MKKTFILLSIAVAAFSSAANTQLMPRLTQGLTIDQLRAELQQASHADRVCPAASMAAYISPEGEIRPYTASGYFYSAFIQYAVNATTIALSPDQHTVYFNSLVPSAMVDCWTAGTIEGNTVTIDCDTYIGNYYGWYDVKAGELEFDAEGAVVGYKDIVLRKDGDSYFVDDDEQNPQRYIALLAFVDGEYKGFIAYALLASYQPANVGEPVAPPSDAELVEYIYSYDYYGVPTTEKGLGCIDGTDMYLNCLCPSTSYWVKGTIEGSQVTFPAGQYLGADIYYYYYNPLLLGEMDEYGNIPATSTDMVFDIDANGRLTQANTNVVSSYSYTTTPTDVANFASNFVITPYFGAQWGIPTDPCDLWISDYEWESYGQMQFQYTLRNFGTNGAYLDPDKFFYTIYLDEEPYVVGPDNFAFVSEDMVQIPLNYRDEANGFDLGPGYAYIPENLFQTIGIQSIYYYEGKPYYSNIVSVDLEGNVYVKEVHNDDPIGIYNINDERIQHDIINAMGIKTKAMSRGVNIVNGKKTIVL